MLKQSDPREDSSDGAGTDTAARFPTPDPPLSTCFSFDVFDTAICRLVHSPEHVHLAVGRKLRERGVINLSDIKWMNARCDAEARQRRRAPHNEVTLEDIYQQLSRALSLTENETMLALETEVGEELRLARPIASTKKRILDLVNAGEQPFFLSDTYLKSDHVKALLTRSGYEIPLDVIASSEELKSKALGDIFAHTASKKNLTGSSFYHLGDNFVSDCVHAKAHGWNAEHFVNSHPTPRERAIYAAGNGDFLSSAIAGCARAARLSSDGTAKDGILTTSSSVVGPLFSGYVLWVILDVLRRGNRTIHFLARDGQIMAAMCKRLIEWLGVDIDVRYTYASRQAFLLAALPDNETEIVEQALAMAISHSTTITLKEAIVGSLKYSDDDLQSISRLTDISPNSLMSRLSDKEIHDLKNTLGSSYFSNQLRHRGRTAKDALLAYLESESFFSQSEATIVDVGWRGSLQARLQTVVGDRVDIVGYYFSLHQPVLGAKAKFRTWMSAPWKAALIETMASADHTSVGGFSLREDGTPYVDPPLADEGTLIDWGVREQQAIAVKFLECFTEAIEAHRYSPDDVCAALKNAGYAAYRHFHMFPTWIEAETYGGAGHQGNPNRAAQFEIAQTVTSFDILRFAFDRKSRYAISNWYMGSIVRSKDKLAPALIANILGRGMDLIVRIRTWRKRRRAAALA